MEMGERDQEIEVKFYIKQLSQVEACLVESGAKLVQSRTHEYNLRFDTQNGELARQSKILRLRRDKVFYLTYKEGNVEVDGASLRKEIEFIVSDFGAARSFLESLGFQVSMIYEKYRTCYKVGDVLVTLDEMPFGDFIEIEGLNGNVIQDASGELGLNWDARILKSYVDLFETARLKLRLNIRDLIFETFQGIVVRPCDLDVLPGDSV